MLYLYLLFLSPLIILVKTDCPCGYGGFCPWILPYDKSENCFCNELSGNIYSQPCDVRSSKLIDHCQATNPCKQGAKCFRTLASYYCDCDTTHHGHKCDRDVEGSNKYLKGPSVFYPINYDRSWTREMFVMVKEVGSDFKLTIDDGGGIIRTYKEDSLQNVNLRAKCQDLLKKKKNFIDPELCALLPEGDVRAVSVPVRYPITSSAKSKLNSKVANKKYPLLGRVDQVNIKMQNGDSVEFENKYPVLTVYDPDTVNCQKDIQFEGCSRDYGSPKVYIRDANFYVKITYKPIYDCAKTDSDKVKWTVYQDGYVKSGGKFQPVIVKETTARFKQFQLDNGTYILEPELTEKGNFGFKKEIKSFDRCWLQIQWKKPTARVTKTDYTIGCKDKLSIDASSSYNPNHPPGNLLFTWSCDKTDENVCKESSSKEMVHTVDGLKCGATYKFLLNLTSVDTDCEPDYLTVTVKVLEANEVHIECVKNCIGKSHPNKKIHLKAVEKYESTDNGKFDWSIQEVGGSAVNIAGIKEVSDESEIIIKADSLKSGSKYLVTVKKNEMTSTYNITMNKGPEKGTCQVVKPAIKGEFIKISCSDFKASEDKSPELKYEVFEFDSEHTEPKYLLGYSYHQVIDGIKLYSSTEVIVQVMDVDGIAVTEKLSAEVSGESDNATDPCTDESINKIKGSIYQLIDDGNVPFALNELTGEVKLLEAHQCLDGYTKIKLLIIMSQFNHSDVSEVHQAALILRNIFPMDIVEKLNAGFEERLILYSGIHVNALSETLVEKSSQQSAKFYCAAKIQLITKHLVQAINGIVLIKENKIVDTEISEMISEIHLQKVKKGISEAMKAFEYIGDAVRYTIDKYDPPFIITAKDLTLSAKIGTADAFRNDTKLPISSNITFKFDKEFLESIDKTEIFVEIVQLNQNPYWWANKTINSDVTKLYIAKKLGDQFHKLYDLSGGIHIYYPIKNSTKLSLTGVASNPDPKIELFKKDEAVSVHRLDIWNGKRGRIYLRAQPADLRVVIMEDKRPDYDNFPDRTFNSTIAFTVMDLHNQAFVYVGVLPSEQTPPNQEVAYILEGFSVWCTLWGDEGWVTGACQAGPDEPASQMHCMCNHLSVFSASLHPPFNKIDFIDDIKLFSELPKNFYVFTMVVILLTLLIILIIWGSFRDKKDNLRRTVIILEDNYPTDNYGYLIAVYTGQRPLAGTTANVGIKLHGELGESNAHILKTELRKTLKRDYDDWFLILTHSYLGKIKSIDLWQDNTGKHPDWYCRKIYVYDLNKELHYIFTIEQWISIAYLDNMHPKYFLYSFEPFVEEPKTQLLKNNALQGFREGHIWSSIMLRHPRSLYTRPQRAMIAVNFILGTMLISMIFFGVREEGPADLPSVTVTVREFLISLYSTLLAIPLVTLVSFCFKKSNFMYVEKRMRKESFNKEEFKRVLGQGTLWHRSWKSVLFIVGYVLTPINLVPVQLFLRESETRRKLWLIISWTVAIAAVAVSSVLVTFFGITFGKNRSLLWMTSYVFGVLENAFLMDPVKIVLVALILAIVFKKTYIEHYILNSSEKFSDLLKKPIREVLAKRKETMYKPLALSQLQEERRNNFFKVSRLYFISELIIMPILLVTVVATTFLIDIRSKYYSNNHVYDLIATEIDRPQNLEFIQNYYNYKDLRNHYVIPGEELIPSEYLHKGIIRIYNKTEFINFLTYSLLPNIHHLKWYNDSLLELEEEEYKNDTSKARASSYVRGWAKDYSTKLMGVPRLRQLRVSPNFTGPVSELFQPYYNYSIGWLTIQNEEHIPCRPGWTRLPRYYDEPPIWSFSTYEATESLGMFGRSGIFYGHGGFVELLHKNLGLSQRKLVKIAMNDWFDNYTRIVVFEANLYNINSNLLSVVSIIAEHLPNGVYLTRCHVEVSYLYMHEHHYSRWVITLVAAVLITTVVVMIAAKSAILVSIFGGKYFFTNWWSVNDILIVLVGVLMLIWYFRSAILFTLYLELLERDKADVYTSFFIPMNCLSESSILMGVFATLAAVRCLNFIRIKTTYSLLEKLYRQSVVFYLTLFILFIFYEHLLFILSVLWNYPLLHKYIIFPVYKNYFQYNEKNDFHKGDYLPLLFAYLLVTLSTIATVILISKYRIAVRMQREENRSAEQKRFIPSLTLRELTSGRPFYQYFNLRESRSLRLKGGAYHSSKQTINSNEGHYRKNQLSAVTEINTPKRNREKTINDTADDIINLTELINKKLELLLKSF